MHQACVKDYGLKYTKVSEEFAEKALLDSPKSAIGKCDRDFGWRGQANVILEKDHIAFNLSNWTHFDHLWVWTGQRRGADGQY